MHTTTIVTDAGRVDAAGHGTQLDVKVTTNEGWTLHRDDTVAGQTSLRWTTASKTVTLELNASETGISHHVTTESHSG